MADHYLGQIIGRREAATLLQAGKITGPYETATVEKNRILGAEHAVIACRRQAGKIARSKGYDVIVLGSISHSFAPIFGWASQDYEFYRTSDI